MHARLATLVPVAALAAVVAAAPQARDVCSNGQIQCCNSTQQSNPLTLNYLSGLLGLALPSIDGLIGLNCLPITVIGTGTGATCTQQAVCCTNNNFNGLVNLGCTPVNLSL